MIALDEQRILFSDQFKSNSLDELLAIIRSAIEYGHRSLVFDFSLISAAWPDSMIPLLATVDWLRRDGIEVSIVLPRDTQLTRLFLSTSWAHFFEPRVYPASGADLEAFNARRFSSASEQQQVVNEFMRLVVAKLQPSKDVLTALEWSINEVTDNVLTHADVEEGGLIQILARVGSGGLLFCVADSGRGILSSMRDGHPYLATDEAAINEAVKQGVTRDPYIGQGNGLAGTLRIATMSEGKLSITSGTGRFTARSDGQSASTRGLPFVGTAITASIELSTNLRIEDALRFSAVPTQRLNILDYYDTEGGTMVLRILSETDGMGVGSRLAGVFLRQKCLYLLGEEPSKVLVLDWVGISVVSSSFADEAFGKLFVSVGPLEFGARVRHRNLDPINSGLINKAILQRVGHAMTTARSP